MAYNITLTNGNAYATVNDGTTVTNTSTITLIGKNYAGYGAIVDENYVHILENSANGVPPTGALTGQLWYNTTTKQLLNYNGSMFRALTAVTTANTAPTSTTGFNAISGDLWYDNVNAQLNVYTGNTWLVVGPAFTSSQGTSGAIVRTIIDTFAQPHTVIEMYTGGNIVGILSQDSTFTPANAIPGFSNIRPGMQLASIINGIVPGYWANGNISTSGNVYANNIFGSGSLSMAGNITASYLSGNYIGTSIRSPGSNGQILFNSAGIIGAGTSLYLSGSNLVVSGGITAGGIINSTSGGFRFPDGSIQTVAISGNNTVSGVTAGTGINVSSSTGAVTITNTGVTSISGSSGITVSPSTGSSVVSPTNGYNGYGVRTISASAPSGGNDGDIWYQI